MHLFPYAIDAVNIAGQEFLHVIFFLIKEMQLCSSSSEPFFKCFLQSFLLHGSYSYLIKHVLLKT